jgi:hypothetical protein
MRTGDVAVGVALCALALAACNGPDAGTLPTTSPTPVSTSPTPTMVSSSADYAAEARLAVRAYFAALNAALRDPAHRTDDLEALIDPSCGCRQILELLGEEARTARYLDYQYTISDLKVQQAGPLGASLTYVAHQSAGSERTSDGRVVESYPARTTPFSAHFVRKNGRWLIDRADRRQ